MTKVGLLLPISNLSPLLTKNLLDGIKKGFETAAEKPEFHHENIGLGSNIREVVEKTQNLLLFKEVDVIFAMVGHQVVPELVKTVETHQKKLVLLDFGTRPEVASTVSNHKDTVTSIHFGLWEINWHLGHYCGLNIGKNVFVSSDFFHSGYPLVGAFEKGLIQAGGEICGYHITPEDPSAIEHSGTDTFKKAKEAKADVILASYTESHLIHLLKESLNSENDLPVISSCLSLPENGDVEYPNMYTAVQSFLLNLKRESNLSSWLTTLAYANTLQYLQKQDYKSPGSIVIQKGWGPNGFSDQEKDSNEYQNTLSNIEIPQTQEKEENTDTGWTNPYLCI